MLTLYLVYQTEKHEHSAGHNGDSDVGRQTPLQLLLSLSSMLVAAAGDGDDQCGNGEDVQGAVRLLRSPLSVVRIRSSSRGPHKWPASSYVGFKMQSTPLWSLVKHDTCLGTHKHAHTHIDTQILGTRGVCVILSSRSGH